MSRNDEPHDRQNLSGRACAYVCRHDVVGPPPEDPLLRLSTLHIRGFKSIERLDLELRPINVLIGPNGAGKSNFVSFFRMLNEMMEQRLQLFVQRSGRAASLLYYGPKVTQVIEAALQFGRNGYGFDLVPTDDDRLVFSEERTVFVGDHVAAKAVIGRGHEEARFPAEEAQLLAEETRLPEAAEEAAQGLPGYVYPTIATWRVHHFHDTSPSAAVKQEHSLSDNERLRSDAGNLAAFLYLLQERHPQSYETIRSTVRRVFPRFGDFALRPNPLNPERIRLEWREQGSDYPFGPNQLSDGTLRFMALATLLLQPREMLPSLILVDEPELGLHPAAIAVLAGLIRSAASRSQVIITTQSVTLLNEFEPEDVVVVERAGTDDPAGHAADGDHVPSVFRRVETTDELAAWLEDYTVGDLWEMNVLGGRP